MVLADLVTPSMVASLPRKVLAVVGTLDGPASARRDVGRTSHAAILARGRGIPVAFVTSAVLASIPDGSWVIVEASEARASVWVEPDEVALAAARQRQRGLAIERLENRGGGQQLAHLGIALCVNVASPHDDIPDAARGVGLVRTEMMFAGRRTAPSESEQLAALLLITERARGRPVVVRLFDAGGDKPLAWLGGEHDPSHGIRRLLAHPEILATQLRALARAREHADVRVLLPIVRTADDVNAVRALASLTLQLGAMIESPDAADVAESIASAADFVSIGTNDLTATALGLDRTAEAPMDHPRVLRLIRRVVRAVHARGRHVTICGEMAGHERGTRGRRPWCQCAQRRPSPAGCRPSRPGPSHHRGLSPRSRGGNRAPYGACIGPVNVRRLWSNGTPEARLRTRGAR